MDWRETREQWLPAIGLILLGVILHESALQAWWRYDDPQLLLHALRFSLLEIFFDPDAYQQLAAHSFTPLLPLSFLIDYRIAGTPFAGYLHQLLAIIAAALLLDRLLRRYVEPRFAFLGGAAFLAIWPVVYAGRTLMIRHYVEGLVAALIVLILWSRRDSSGMVQQWGKTALVKELLAALLYLVAMLQKEIYAPLPLLLLVQSRANDEGAVTTLRRLVAPAVAAVVYLGWRIAMLGSFGGFGRGQALGDLLMLPLDLSRQLAGPAAIVFQLIFWGVLLLFALTIRKESRLRAAESTAAIVIIAFLPLVTLGGALEWRYTFAVGVLGAGAFALAAGRSALPSFFRSVGGFIAVAALIVAAFANARSYDAVARPHEMEGRYIWTADENAPALLARSSPGWYLSGLAELRRLESGDAAPFFVLSTIPLALGEISAEDVVFIDDAGVELASATTLREVIETERASFDDALPFSIELTRRANLLEWDLQPSDMSGWSFVTMPHYGVFEIPASGRRVIPATPDQRTFTVRAQSSDRWSIAPPLMLPDAGSTTSWSRQPR
jgi:hypothetical protein